MVRTEAEIDRMAAEMITRHGRQAARRAVERLNEMIDSGNSRGRDIWACVVHAIHARQEMGAAECRTLSECRGAVPSLSRPPSRDLGPRLVAF